MMTSDRYREVIKTLGLTQAAAAQFAGFTPRQSRRYAAGDRPVPEAIAMLFEIMVKQKISPERARRLGDLPEEFGADAAPLKMGKRIDLKEAIAEAQRGTLKQRVARHKKRLTRKYGLKPKKIPTNGDRKP